MTNTQKMLEAMSLYPSSWCSDQGEWLEWAMAAKQEGVDYQAFDAWSLQDAARYDESGNRRRWDSLESRAGGLGFGSIATRYLQPRGITVGQDGDTRPRKAPAKAQSTTTAPQTGVQQCATQIAALFEPGENVAIEPAVHDSGKDHKQHPDKNQGRVFDRDALLGILQAAESAGVTELANVQGLDGAVSPDGAYLTINPVTKAGRAKANITAWRHVLIECDDLPRAEQLRILTQTLELPCTTLVDSGHKSIHALIRVDASSEAQYKEIFNQIADWCKANGLTADTRCNDPSRLSRLAGAVRVERHEDGTPYEPQPQALISCSPGSSWTGYVGRVLAEQAQSTTTDAMPEADTLGDWWDVDRRAQPLIDGMVRHGHVMIMQGPSKAGKSWLSIGLATATATGSQWMARFPCTQSKVLYVNFEIDKHSLAQRFKKVAQVMYRLTKDRDQQRFKQDVEHNLSVLNLRGVCGTTEDYTDAIIRAATKNDVALVIIDPLYMYSDADENSAGETKKIMAQMGRIAKETGATVYAVHHYTKGTPGKKQALDRGSGSGVFGRAPDCVMDFAPLEVEPGNTEVLDLLDGATPFLVTLTLREFAPMQPFVCIYKHPVHLVRDDAALRKLAVKGADSAAAARERQSMAASRELAHQEKVFNETWAACSDYHTTMDGLTVVTYNDFYSHLNHDPLSGGLKGARPTLKNKLAQSAAYCVCSCSELDLDHKALGLNRANMDVVALKDQVSARRKAQADGQDATEVTEDASQDAGTEALCFDVVPPADAAPHALDPHGSFRVAPQPQGSSLTD